MSRGDGGTDGASVAADVVHVAEHVEVSQKSAGSWRSAWNPETLVPSWCQTWTIHRVSSARAVTREARQFARLGSLDPAELAPAEIRNQ
jgi:hypothetical protein